MPTIPSHHWLSESGLTQEGKQLRDKYTQFAAHQYSQGVPAFRAARALHLLQSVSYSMIDDGYALPPHTINFCVNNVCNLKCVYCDLNHGIQSDTASNALIRDNVVDTTRSIELPFEKCKEMVDAVAWFRPTIRVPRMEPLLYSHILDFADYAKSRGMPFSLLTNGLLLKKFAQELVRLKVDALRISLDGSQSIHDRMCGVPGAYAVILEGLRTLVDECKSAGHPMQIGCYFTLTDMNHDRMLELVEDVAAHGLLDDIYFGFYMFNYISKGIVQRHNAEHAALSGTVADETSAFLVHLEKVDIDTVVRQVAEIQQRFVSKGARIHFRPNFTRENLEYALSDAIVLPDSVRCDTPWHTLYVMPNGLTKHHPQCMFPPYGNVLETPFMDVWNGETMRKQRILLQKYKAFHACTRCWSVFYSMEDVQKTWKDDSARR